MTKQDYLVVVDYQNDFVTGALGTPEAVSIHDNVARAIEEHLENGGTVIFTQDTHNDDYLSTQEGKNLPVVHCIDGSEGWKIPEDIDVPECIHVSKDSFGYPDWDVVVNEVGGVRSVKFIGVCTGICVVSNVLIFKAMYPEAEVTVDASCCACVTPESHEAALKTMRTCQVNVIGG